MLTASPGRTTTGAVSSGHYTFFSFKAIHIPTLREIIDVADLDASLWIHAPGQSGHPASRHYGDFIKMWSTHRYHPAAWDKDSLRGLTRARLGLQPRAR